MLRTEEELEWMYREIQKKLRIEKLRKLKKHLGIWYEWKTERGTGELYLEASKPKLIEEIIEHYKKATEKARSQDLYYTRNTRKVFIKAYRGTK
jgi:hypothetical protein